MSSVDFSICLAAIVSAFCCARAVPFTSLIVSASLAPSFSAVRLGTGSFLAGVDERLRLIIDRTYPYWSMVVALISMIGALWMTSVIAPQLPQPSTAFKPPFAAAQFLESKAPPGNLLNDPHFGDVMMWTMRNCPKTFLDSRYDMFAFSLIQEYWRMVLCKEDWRELMDKYKIAWVFLPPNLPLVKALKDDGWLVSYEDEAAVVMRKPL